MAADQLITFDDGSQPYRTCKLRRLSDGSIVGYCGSGYESMLAWLEDGMIKENAPERKDKEDWQILRLTRSGIYVYTNHTYADPMRHRMFAIGSGADVALYVMKILKKSPTEAARAATKVVRTCGGKIDVMKLKL